MWLVFWLLLVENRRQHIVYEREPLLPQKRDAAERQPLLRKERDTRSNARSPSSKTRLPWARILTSRAVWALIIVKINYALVVAVVGTKLPAYIEEILGKWLF